MGWTEDESLTSVSLLAHHGDTRHRSSHEAHGEQPEELLQKPLERLRSYHRNSVVDGDRRRERTRTGDFSFTSNCEYGAHFLVIPLISR